jgi:hypothetical protein
MALTEVNADVCNDVTEIYMDNIIIYLRYITFDYILLASLCAVIRLECSVRIPVIVAEFPGSLLLRLTQMVVAYSTLTYHSHFHPLYITQTVQCVLEQLIGSGLFKKFSVISEPEGSGLCSQIPAGVSNPQLAE